jgi:hypothetical protein
MPLVHASFALAGNFSSVAPARGISALALNLGDLARLVPGELAGTLVTQPPRSPDLLATRCRVAGRSEIGWWRAAAAAVPVAHRWPSCSARAQPAGGTGRSRSDAYGEIVSRATGRIRRAGSDAWADVRASAPIYEAQPTSQRYQCGCSRLGIRTHPDRRPAVWRTFCRGAMTPIRELRVPQSSSAQFPRRSASRHVGSATPALARGGTPARAAYG